MNFYVEQQEHRLCGPQYMNRMRLIWFVVYVNISILVLFTRFFPAPPSFKAGGYVPDRGLQQDPGSSLGLWHLPYINICFAFNAFYL